MRFITADKIFDGSGYLPSGTVLVLNPQNLLMDILDPGQIEINRIQHFSDLLCPGFVNVHCHLELSHLKGLIPRNTGLSGFARSLISKRGMAAPEERFECMKEADQMLWKNGIVAVGDISNTSESLSVKCDSKIHYHTFVELIGLQAVNASAIFDKGKELLHVFKREGLAGSLVPHAPYSVSSELAALISAEAVLSQAPICIHNQESAAELQFFIDKSGNINDLYAFLDLDISFFKAPGSSSLKVFDKLLQSRPRIFVHSTFSTREDLQQAADVNTFWCFCPKANLYIEGVLPDYSLFPAETICFGTDSLASNDELNLCSELTAMRSAAACFDDLQLLKALTSNGARALGLQEDCGSLVKNKNTGLNHIKINKEAYQFIKKVA